MNTILSMKQSDHVEYYGYGSDEVNATKETNTVSTQDEYFKNAS